MVQIRYLNRSGDSRQTLCLDEAKNVVAEELERGNIVYDEDEKRIVEKATLGKIKAESNIAVFPRIAGG